VQTKIAKSINSGCEEMQRVFLRQMNRLLLPAYLLTGSHELASECFLEAWKDCMDAPSSSERDAFQAAKDAVVNAAIRRIAEDIAHRTRKYAPNGFAGREANAEARRRHAGPGIDSATFRCAVLTLNAFERAVLVLRLYERYSPADVARLLQVSRQMLENGWLQGLSGLLGRLNATRTVPPRIADAAEAAPQAWEPEAAGIRVSPSSL
jgi:DNA-directed RNA polymerase specialized sigma24 family protein